MTNSEKARELAIKSTIDIDDKGNEVYNCLVEAAQQEMAAWKEKQMIEKMENCVKELYLPAYSYLDRDNLELIQDIKEAMMEE